jgi:hypothetical protein
MRALALVVVLASGCGRLSFNPLSGSDGDAVLADASVDVPPPVPSNVSYDTTSAQFGGNVTNLPLTHTVTGAGLLVAFVATRNSSPTAPPAVTSISYGSQSLTKLEALCPGCGTGGINNLELWYLPNPNVGSFTVDVALAGSAKGAAVVMSSYLGASMISANTSTFGTSMTASVTWTNPAEGAWAIAGAMNQGGFGLDLLANGNQSVHSDTQCDTSNYQGSNAADQKGVAANQQVTFAWAIGAGTGLNCILTPQVRDWIAIGASIY